MYKFTPGKEMEELKELFEKGMIEGVITKEGLMYPSFSVEFSHNDILGKILVLSSVLINLKNIDWEETAKLVKEEKMEKVVINKFENLEANVGNVICGFWDVNGTYCVHTAGVIFNAADIEEAVKILNALGGNFEYQEVEVIDSYEKFHNFLKRLYSYVDDRFFYTFNYEDKNFLQFGCTHHNLLKTFKIQEIEKQFNVDLQILRGE